MNMATLILIGFPLQFEFSKKILVSLTRTSHRLSTAAADLGMSTALRSVGLLDILSSMPAGPFVTRG